MKTKTLKAGYSLIKTNAVWNLTFIFPGGKKVKLFFLYKDSAMTIKRHYMKLISKGLVNG